MVCTELRLFLVAALLGLSSPDSAVQTMMLKIRGGCTNDRQRRVLLGLACICLDEESNMANVNANASVDEEMRISLPVRNVRLQLALNQAGGDVHPSLTAAVDDGRHELGLSGAVKLAPKRNHILPCINKR